MYSSFHRFFFKASKSALPLLTVAFLSTFKNSIHNQTTENLQSQPSQQQIQNLNAQIINAFQQRHANWQWDRIIQINSPQQLTQADILEKTIIVYQMTGKSQIDSQVALMSHLFCDKYFGKISERFQFVFLTPNPHMQAQQDLLYVIFGKEGTKYVPIRKYINSGKKHKFIPNYNPLFGRLIEEVNKYQQVSLENIKQHLEHINCQGRDTYQLVIIPQNDSQLQINRSKHIMQKFLKNRQIWNSEIVKSVITDKQTQTILGLNHSDIQKNKVYLISPKNENLVHYNPQKMFRIWNKFYTIIPADQIQKQFIFPPIPPQLSNQSYILKFNIDLNQTRPQVLTSIYDMMRDQKLLSQLRIPKLLTFSKGDQSIEITIQKNNHDNIVHAYDEGCMYDDTYKKDLLLKSNMWKYPYETLDTQALKQFVKVVMNKTHQPQNQQKKAQYQYFKSQSQAQSVRHNSRLIVGQQRTGVINSNEDKVIFHYSKNCHSCKKFKGTYEQIAGQKKDIRFYRIDNDTNKTQGLKNYNSTPIFVMYKKGYHNLPWYFKMPYFTKTLFSNFVSITKQLHVMNSASFKSHIMQFEENEKLVKQTLKEVL